jgi:hypothetical protein
MKDAFEDFREGMLCRSHLSHGMITASCSTVALISSIGE